MTAPREPAGDGDLDGSTRHSRAATGSYAPWVEAWLSPSRWRPYVAAAGGDLGVAWQLHQWNAAVSAALFRDLGALEVALRNAYDRAVRSQWHRPTHWLLDPESPVSVPLLRTRGSGASRTTSDVNARLRADLRAVVSRCGGPAHADPGQVIAQLPFGFWRYLTSAAREKVLWVPYLHAAVPRRVSRAAVDTVVSRLHAVRNRIAHHEPLLRTDLVQTQGSLLTLAGWLLPELRAHLAASSELPELIADRPGAGARQ